MAQLPCTASGSEMTQQHARPCVSSAARSAPEPELNLVMSMHTCMNCKAPLIPDNERAQGVLTTTPPPPPTSQKAAVLACPESHSQTMFFDDSCMSCRTLPGPASFGNGSLLQSLDLSNNHLVSMPASNCSVWSMWDQLGSSWCRMAHGSERLTCSTGGHTARIMGVKWLFWRLGDTGALKQQLHRQVATANLHWLTAQPVTVHSHVADACFHLCHGQLTAVRYQPHASKFGSQ